MELGATVCRPRTPSCSACPVAGGCARADRGAGPARPVRALRGHRSLRARTRGRGAAGRRGDPGPGDAPERALTGLERDGLIVRGAAGRAQSALKRPVPRDPILSGRGSRPDPAPGLPHGTPGLRHRRRGRASPPRRRRRSSTTATRRSRPSPPPPPSRSAQILEAAERSVAEVHARANERSRPTTSPACRTPRRACSPSSTTSSPSSPACCAPCAPPASTSPRASPSCSADGRPRAPAAGRRGADARASRRPRRPRPTRSLPTLPRPPTIAARARLAAPAVADSPRRALRPRPTAAPPDDSPGPPTSRRRRPPPEDARRSAASRPPGDAPARRSRTVVGSDRLPAADEAGARALIALNMALSGELARGDRAASSAEHFALPENLDELLDDVFTQGGSMSEPDGTRRAPAGPRALRPARHLRPDAVGPEHDDAAGRGEPAGRPVRGARAHPARRA